MLKVNIYPLAEQRTTYETFQAALVQFDKENKTVENETEEIETVDFEAAKAHHQLFEDLWKCDYEMLEHKKRMFELKHANHEFLIDENLMAEFRELSYDVSARFFFRHMENDDNFIFQFFDNISGACCTWKCSQR